MSGKDWALLLSILGVLMNGLGLYLAIRAIYEETQRKDLHPGWRNTLDWSRARADAVFRALLRRDRSGRLIEVSASDAMSIGSGEFSAVVSTPERPDPQTVAELHALMEGEIAKVREAITAQANDAAQRLGALGKRLDREMEGVSARFENAEKTDALIDTHTLNREMWGLVWVGAGSLMQAIAIFVGR